MIPLIIAEELLTFREALFALGSADKLAKTATTLVSSSLGQMLTSKNPQGALLEHFSKEDDAFFKTLGYLTGYDASVKEGNPAVSQYFEQATNAALVDPLFLNASPDPHSRTISFMSRLANQIPNFTPSNMDLGKYIDRMTAEGVSYDPFGILATDPSITAALLSEWARDEKSADVVVAYLSWRAENNDWTRKAELLKILSHKLLFVPNSFPSMLAASFASYETKGVDRRLQIRGRIFSFAAHLPLAQSQSFVPRGWRHSWPTRALTQEEIRELDRKLTAHYGIKVSALASMIKQLRYDDEDVDNFEEDDQY